jgi:hypothetical protein
MSESIERNCVLTPRPEFAIELYRPSDRRLSAKLVPTFADRGCRMVSVTDPYGRILGFLDRGIVYIYVYISMKLGLKVALSRNS